MAATVEETNNSSYSIDSNNVRKYKREWMVTFDLTGDDNGWIGSDAVDAVGVYIGEPYGVNSYCLGIDAKQVTNEDSFQWLVNADYGPYPESKNINPLLVPLEISWGAAQFQRTTIDDIFGNPILNTAGDSYEPIDVDDSRLILTVVRNEVAYDPQLAAAYKDAINADEFLGAPKYTIKASPVQTQRIEDQIFGVYYRSTYTFHYNPDTWKKKLLCRGLHYLVDGKKHNCMIQRVEVTEPVHLDKDGRQLEPGGTPYYQTFRIYKELPFSTFNFS